MSICRTLDPRAIGVGDQAEDRASIDFASADLFDRLETATPDDLDALPFGVIAMSAEGTVLQYNTYESGLSGLTPKRVIGRNFFTSVAPCTDSMLIARRFRTEPLIDDTIKYVFTFRLTPKNVRLRLMKRPTGHCMYLVVQATE